MDFQTLKNDIGFQIYDLFVPSHGVFIPVHRLIYFSCSRLAYVCLRELCRSNHTCIGGVFK